LHPTPERRLPGRPHGPRSNRRTKRSALASNPLLLGCRGCHVADIRHVLEAQADRLFCSEVKTLHLGPQSILVALIIERKGKTLAKAERDLSDMTAQIKSLDERITYVYFQLG
jgi:hypothetical protein